MKMLILINMNVLAMDQYECSGYGIEFDARGSFSLSNDRRFRKNVVIFDVDMS